MTDLAIDPIFSDAVIFASLLALLSIGLTLTYLTTRVPNFAHASFATIGVYIALITSRVWNYIWNQITLRGFFDIFCLNKCECRCYVVQLPYLIYDCSF